MTPKPGGHHRVYRSLLRLYPADYRAHYSDQMVQLFSDQVRDEGSARSWLKALADIPGSALSEQLRSTRTLGHSTTLAPAPTITSRLLGILGVVAGVILLVGFLPIAMSSELLALRLVLFNFGVTAVVTAVHRRQSMAGRGLALTGAIPAIITNGTYLVLLTREALLQPGQIGPGDVGPIHLLGYFGAAMWVADAWFGLVTWRLGVISRSSALALAVGSLLTLLGMSNFGIWPPGSGMEQIIMGGIALQGSAWVLLGLEVALHRRPAPASPA